MKTEAGPYHFLLTGGVPARGNVTAVVTDTLRQAIVSLQMKPGEVIDKGAVCERLGVSRFPVSEALARLSAEGLVDIQPQRGSVVSLVRVSDVAEYMLIRRALECEVVRVVAAEADPAVVESLRVRLSRQKTAAEADQFEVFHTEDLAFHETLFDALSLPRVKTAVDGARANLDRARQLVNSPRRLALTIAEHEAIVKGLAARDPDAAAAAMRAHLDAVIDEVTVFARAHPELFAGGAEN